MVENAVTGRPIIEIRNLRKVYRRDRQEVTVLDGITLRAMRFEFEPEVTAKVLRRGIRIYEVPISYTGREFDEGKKITWRDGFAALWALAKFRFAD